MNTYRLLQGFTLTDPRFFDDISRHPSLGDLEQQVGSFESVKVKVSRRGPWISCRPVDAVVPPHGWKIHISVSPAQAMPALKVLLAEFARKEFHFKVLRDTALVLGAASPWWPAAQVGKIAVVYPTSADHSLELLERLYAPLDGFAGPRVLTDRRYRDSKCLYYRYGEFSGEHRIRPDGTSAVVLFGPEGQEWTDERLPAYRKPPWAQDLLPVRTGPASRQLNGYVVTTALRHNGCGGIYLARHPDNPAPVLLKESRPRTAFDEDGLSGPARLRREFDALTRLHGAGVGPEPLDLFEHHEHLFLAREHIEAIPLAAFAAERSPLSQSGPRDQDLMLYRRQVRTIVTNLRASVAVMHEQGMFHGDLSSSNVLVDPHSLAVHLVGFGSSRPFAEWTGTSPAEPGFRPPPRSAPWADPRRFDAFGVASAELALITPHGALRDLDPEAVVRSARRAAALLRYPLGDLLTELELPEDESPEPRDLGLVVEQAVRFLEGTLTPDRSDRPFPSSPEMYARNPWSVAHGAAGVARGLHTITGRVHPALQEWMSTHAAMLDTLPPGLYSGLAGVGWTLLDIGETDHGLELIGRANLADPGDLPAKMLDGVAGLGLANLAAWHRTGRAEFLDVAARLGSSLVDSASDSGHGLCWPEAGARTQSFGYAHGSSGVALFLLYLHFAIGGPQFVRAARKALDHDINQLTLRISDRREPYWERGLAGFGGVLTRFCRVTEDPALRDVLTDVTARAAHRMTPGTGLFGGAAGIVNFALDGRDLLNDQQYGDLAAELARSITMVACRQPEGLAFPGHGLLRHSNDFAFGGTGVVLVLDRLRRGGRDFNYTLDELLPIRG